MLEIGMKAPAISLPDQNGEIRTLEEFQGKKVILYFYPKDNTPGCTAEACSLRDYNGELESMRYKVIGISKDSAASHVKFAGKYELPFVLLSDKDTVVNQAFGVWQKKKMAGREYMGTVRTTFVTDAEHRICRVLTKVDTKNAGRQLLDLLESAK